MRNKQDEKIDENRLGEGKKLRPTSKARKQSCKSTMSAHDHIIKTNINAVDLPCDSKQSDKDDYAQTAIARIEKNVLAKPKAKDDKSPSTAAPGVVSTNAPYQGKDHPWPETKGGETPSNPAPNASVICVDKASPATTNNEAADPDYFRNENNDIDHTRQIVGAVRIGGINQTTELNLDESFIDNKPEDIKAFAGDIEAFVVPSVYHASDVVPIKSDEELEAEARKKYIKRFIFVACTLAVIAVGISVPVSLATVEKLVIVITEEPSASFTSMPSSLPSLAPTQERYKQTIELLTDSSLSDAAVLFREQNVSTREQLLNKESPQGKALNWVVNEDPMSLEIDNPKYIQRYIMAVFYYTMDGPNWIQCFDECNECEFWSKYGPGSWLSGDDECDWYTDACVDGEIRRIFRVGCGLKAEFPKEICYFTRMNVIDVHGQINGTIPACFGKFSRLQYLDLTSNEIELPIYNEVVDGWKSLQVLHLAGNRIAGPFPTSLLKLPSIKELSLSDNDLTGPFPALNSSVQWESLQVLFLGGNELAGPFPKSLLKLPLLEELSLSDNDLTGPFPEFDSSAAPFLTSLNLNENRLQGDIPLSLCEIPNLHVCCQQI